MSPGYVSTSHRGGCGFTRAPAAASRTFGLNRAVPFAATRDFAPRAGFRNHAAGHSKFSVSAERDGSAHVTLDPNETGRVVIGDDGSVSIEITGDATNGGNGTAALAAPCAEWLPATKIAPAKPLLTSPRWWGSACRCAVSGVHLALPSDVGGGHEVLVSGYRVIEHTGRP